MSRTPGLPGRDGPRKRAGRHPSPYPVRYQLRTTSDSFASWLAAAGVTKTGPEFAHWCRDALDRAARKERVAIVPGVYRDPTASLTLHDPLPRQSDPTDVSRFK